MLFFMKEIEIGEALESQDHVFIDVRSPGEFADCHIPGAINLPLFTNEERATIGTTYKQMGQGNAKWVGMQVVSPKIPDMMEKIKEHIHAGKKPIIYCWRGGMRSKSVTTFADMSGLDIQKLAGGFRSYRQWVVQQLTADLLPKRFVVLHGMTGVGKTIILHKLHQKGFPILDLEKCAGHRGSVFGGIGYNVANQKTFESHLVHDLMKVKGLPYVFMEAESRRIGKSTQPDFLMEAKRKGIHIMLETTLDIRVERTHQEYVDLNIEISDFQNLVEEAIAPISKRFSPAFKEQVQEALAEKDYKTLIKILLNDYYDPRYQHKQDEYEGDFTTIEADDMDKAVEDIIQYIQTRETKEKEKQAQP
jgi:tRNA 2-selenouridine synthase